jgi:hypothetical protein
MSAEKPDDMPKNDNISNIQIKGKEADITSFVQMLSDRTGNVYNLAGDYLCIEQDNNINSSSTSISMELGDLIGQLFENQTELPINIVRDSERALFDSYDFALIDIGDLEKVNSILQAAFIGHALEEWGSVEGYSNPSSRTDAAYETGHQKGLVMESSIANSMLGQPYELVKDLGSTFVETSSKNIYTLDQGNVSISTGGYHTESMKYGKTTLSYDRNAKITQNPQYQKYQNRLMKSISVGISKGYNVIR